MPVRYIPKRGDVVHLTFDPQSGHEQKGRRTALIISHELFNRATGLAIVCPITNTNKNIPFHIKIPEGIEISGFIMVEQVKSIDFKARKVQRVDSVSQEILKQVLGILDACIY